MFLMIIIKIIIPTYILIVNIIYMHRNIMYVVVGNFNIGTLESASTNNNHVNRHGDGTY